MTVAGVFLCILARRKCSGGLEAQERRQRRRRGFYLAKCTERESKFTAWVNDPYCPITGDGNRWPRWN